MDYQILWERAAERRWRKLPLPIRRRLATAVEALARDPRPRGVIKLHGELEGHYRIWVGRSLRVVYRVSDSDREVTIVLVGPRKSIY